MNLMLAPGLLERVIAGAKASYPREGCGFLVGRRIAERFIPMLNICASDVEYEADPADPLFAAFVKRWKRSSRSITPIRMVPLGRPGDVTEVWSAAFKVAGRMGLG